MTSSKMAQPVHDPRCCVCRLFLCIAEIATTTIAGSALPFATESQFWVDIGFQVKTMTTCVVVVFCLSNSCP